jgi:catechol 2,3-dioxygenase-like lactoylglutathione lyase family enzyme
MITPGIDHIAMNVPDLDAQIERLTGDMGLVLEHRFGDFALISDPSSGLKLELGRSDDDQLHFRHFGFRTTDVDGAHARLVDAGMTATEPPHRRDFAAMYTSFLSEPGCAEVQLVTYDAPSESPSLASTTGDDRDDR